MIFQILLFIAGLAGLYFGAEWLVKGATRFARAFYIKPVVIGLTIVAFGTSTPELVTSVIAAIRHSSDIAMGNVIGSNIANIGLILGLSALVQPLKVDMKLLYREMPIMVGISLFLYFIGWDVKPHGRCYTLGRYIVLHLLCISCCFKGSWGC